MASGKLFRNAEVRIVDVPMINGNIIDGASFIDCVLLGPAVIVPTINFTITECFFPGNDAGEFDEEAFFWAMGDRSAMCGGIEVRNTVIKGCQFVDIGVGVHPGNRQQWRESVGLQ